MKTAERNRRARRWHICFACLLLALLLAGCNVESAAHTALDVAELSHFFVDKAPTIGEEETADANFEVMAQNGGHSLLFNPLTAEVAIGDAGGRGLLWRSNPAGRFEDGTAEAASGQIYLNTYNRRDVSRSWNTWSDAVKYGQFEHTSIENGVRVEYLLGKTAKVYLLPHAMTQQRYDEDILPKVEAAGQLAFFKRMYTLTDLEKIDSGQTRDNLLATYAGLAEQPLYTLKGSPSNLEYSKLEGLFEEIGYTMEELALDDEAAGYAGAAQGEHILLAVEYTLENGQLVLRLPVADIQASPGLRVASVSPLKYFGSPGTQPEGMALVPDGSGAVISFEQPVSAALPMYRERVYGKDYARLDPDEPVAAPDLYLPVYGVGRGESCYVAHIESGAALASIIAEPSRGGATAAYVAAEFQLLDSAVMSLDASPDNMVRVFPRQMPEEDIVIRYLFSADGGDFVQMAALLRAEYDRLGVFAPESDPGEVPPAVLELLGAIDKQVLVVGVPTQSIEALSTYKDVAAELQALGEVAGPGLSVVLNGWQAGGYRSGPQKSASFEGKLGGGGAFRDLAAACADLGVALYPAADVQYVYNDGWFDGFSTGSDGAVQITGSVAFKPEYSLATFHFEQKGLSAYMTSPGLWQEYLQGAAGGLAENGANALALEHLARDLYSDYNTQNPVNRNQAAVMAAEGLAALRQAGTAVAANGCNEYALAAAGLVYNIPAVGRMHPLFAQNVPFVQAVLSGRVACASNALNYSADPRAQLLKCIETGSGLYLDAFLAEASAVKDSDFDYKYASSLGLWREFFAQAVQELRAALAPAWGSSMSGHQTLANGLVKVSYENGAVIYVNYGATDLKDGAVTVPAGGWAHG